MDLPEGFTFHCQASQRFSDEDMQEIVELDENKNPTGLKSQCSSIFSLNG